MIKIGILFGGASREREISFAGGRTVYDSLDKSLFEPIPFFIDAKGQFILLNWQFVYKGSIRDFYPPKSFLPSNYGAFQLYAESLNLSAVEEEKMIAEIGEKIEVGTLAELIDVAFLCLHGPFGEDGSIQGLLDFYGIPYTGSGVYASSIGISKAKQKELMKLGGFTVNSFYTFNSAVYDKNPVAVFDKICAELQFPVVIKASSQGSSIGVHFLDTPDYDSFTRIINQCLFRKTVEAKYWNSLNSEEKNQFIRELCDLQFGLGLPLLIDGEFQHTANEVLASIDHRLANNDSANIEAYYAEPELVVEEKIIGKEFSCIVIRNQDGKIIALPPTEIRKKADLFDYRSKYLPGITRKVTPIEIPENQIAAIRTACSQLFSFFNFNVYARIDGFITPSGAILLNDPNTTSGMLPSSFFFHQAAEIGLSPIRFLTYIIHQSLVERIQTGFRPHKIKELLNKLDQAIKLKSNDREVKTRIGVIFGGYSTERHISVESGRNVFEKLSSTGMYHVIPLFLMKRADQISLYKVPINLLLKDNADDIRDKILNFHTAPIINKIIEEASEITLKFVGSNYEFEPQEIELEELSKHIDFAFMALHGRPGEDGTLQTVLEKQRIPYNGSGPATSATTIDKYVTNNILRSHGILVAKNHMIWKDKWLDNRQEYLDWIEHELGFPLIAKPADDGCSSAVKKINNAEELINFAHVILRDSEELNESMITSLHLKSNEEFPFKEGFLIEELISAKGAAHFLEVTGGLLSYINDKGELAYEMFEASESVAEEGILSLEEKFLAGEGQNITPARYHHDPQINASISSKVKDELEKVAQIIGIEGYCRIDAFVRIYNPEKVEVIVIEINSLPGLTPATCIFHQAALNEYKPAGFLQKIIEFGTIKNKLIK